MLNWVSMGFPMGLDLWYNLIFVFRIQCYIPFCSARKKFPIFFSERLSSMLTKTTRNLTRVFSEFYSLRACFCLAIIPTTESCEKARADRVVSALPALKVNLRHWERKHLRNNLPDPAGIGIFSQRNSSWFELRLYTSKLFWNIDLLQNVR